VSVIDVDEQKACYARKKTEGPEVMGMRRRMISW
jgi:hypothetical protein